MRDGGRASFSRSDDRSSMQHMMSVPNDLVRPPKPGVLDRFKTGCVLQPVACMMLVVVGAAHMVCLTARSRALPAVRAVMTKPEARGFCRQRKSAALSDDNLNAHNQLQSNKGGAASEMVFMSPLDHDSVKAALQDHSHVDASLPLDLSKMPKMPKS